MGYSGATVGYSGPQCVPVGWSWCTPLVRTVPPYPLPGYHHPLHRPVLAHCPVLHAVSDRQSLVHQAGNTTNTSSYSFSCFSEPLKIMKNTKFPVFRVLITKESKGFMPSRCFSGFYRFLLKSVFKTTLFVKTLQ